MGICHTVLDSWWWTVNLSETCTVLFQNKFEKLVHLGFYYKNVPIYLYIQLSYFWLKSKLIKLGKLLWVKEHRLLQIAPEGTEAGAPLMHHLMYCCLSCCCWNHCKPWLWCLGKCFSTDGPWHHHQCTSPLSNPLEISIPSTENVWSRSQGILCCAPCGQRCWGHVPSAGRSCANPPYSYMFSAPSRNN